jgi:iron complex outermembrane recepter protein
MILVFVALGAVACAGQTAGECRDGDCATISGSVLDPQRRAVPNATLVLSGGALPAPLTVNTNSAGEFLFSRLPASTYSLDVVGEGFAEWSGTLELSGSQELRQRIVLQLPTVEETVEVADKQAVVVDTLDMSEVRESPAKDVGEALEAVDGVWKIRKAGIANDVVVRGFQQNNINVTVNGARIYGACPGHMDPAAQHVDFAEVDRVEVVKGAFDVTNQGSLGALVKIMNKDPGTGLRLKPSLSAGSFGFYNPAVTGAYGSDRFKLLLGYSYRSSDPYKDGSGRPFTDYANYNTSAFSEKAFQIHTGWFSMEFKPAEKQALWLGYTRQASGLVLYPYLTMDSDYDNADRTTLKYRATDISSSMRALRMEAYFTQVNHFMSDSERTSAGNSTPWTMASPAKSRAIGGRLETDLGHDLTLGLESYYRNWNVLGYMRMGPIVTTNLTVPDVDTRAAGAFADYRHRLGEKVQLSGGVRFDHASMRVSDPNASTNLYYLYHDTRRTSNMDNYPSGNARISFFLPRSTELFLGVGSTARIPDAAERYISRMVKTGPNVGNPLLPPTRNTEFTVGLNLRRGGSYLKPVLFYSHLNDYIVVNNQPLLNMTPISPMTVVAMAMPTAGARSEQNVDARIYGGEVAYALALNNAVSFSGGTSYSRGIKDEKAIAGILSTNLAEMPPLRTRLAMRYVYKTTFAEVGGVAVNRQSRVDGDVNETATPGYFTMNFKLGTQYRKVHAMFAIDNVLNRFYYEHLSYYRDPFRSGVKVPEPGRNVFVQLSYTF